MITTILNIITGIFPQETADLVTFTEEILNGKLHFLCSCMNCFTALLDTLSPCFYIC